MMISDGEQSEWDRSSDRSKVTAVSTFYINAIASCYRQGTSMAHKKSSQTKTAIVDQAVEESDFQLIPKGRAEPTT